MLCTRLSDYLETAFSKSAKASFQHPEELAAYSQLRQLHIGFPFGTGPAGGYGSLPVHQLEKCSSTLLSSLAEFLAFNSSLQMGTRQLLRR